MTQTYGEKFKQKCPVTNNFFDVQKEVMQNWMNLESSRFQRRARDHSFQVPKLRNMTQNGVLLSYLKFYSIEFGFDHRRVKLPCKLEIY